MTASTSPLACACPKQDSTVRSRIVRQFAHPTGWLGHLAGHVMAVKNRRRGQWVVSLLGIQPGERILEIGFGPGVDLRRVGRLAADGLVAGIDHSHAMVAQARRRNARAVREGRVVLHCAPADRIPHQDASFDIVFSINSAQFWEDVPAALAEQRRVLCDGGRIAVVVQPRSAGADEAVSAATGRWLSEMLRQSGFRDVRLDMLPQRSVPVACALGVK